MKEGYYKSHWQRMKKFANQVKVTQHQHGTQKGFSRLYFLETDGFLHKEPFNLKYIAFTYNGVMKGHKKRLKFP